MAFAPAGRWYLVGFTLSTVLCGSSPGRTLGRRVAVRRDALVCDREFEIEKFVHERYW